MRTPRTTVRDSSTFAWRTIAEQPPFSSRDSRTTVKKKRQSHYHCPSGTTADRDAQRLALRTSFSEAAAGSLYPQSDDAFLVLAPTDNRWLLLQYTDTLDIRTNVIELLSSPPAWRLDDLD